MKKLIYKEHQVKISDIPADVVNNHNESLYYWVKSGIKSATLLHVDAHHDLLDQGTPFSEYFQPDSYKDFDIANFICPAVYHGIINSIYWLNPHSKSRKLQCLKDVKAVVKKSMLPEYSEYFWEGYGNLKVLIVGAPDEGAGCGKTISPEKIIIPSSFILDFDLDAFCCHQHVHNTPIGYDGVSDFEERIEETAQLLENLPKPDLVTIARSQGNGMFGFVPWDMVDLVQECLIENLRRIYSK